MGKRATIIDGRSRKRLVLSTRSGTRPTPREWGLAQASQAPAWSDELWQKALATIGIGTHMDIYCDRFSVCNSIYMDRGEQTVAMAQAKGWIVWRGQTMGGKDSEVTLCDKCVEATRRSLRQPKHVPLPNQYPIPELKVIPGGQVG